MLKCEREGFGFYPVRELLYNPSKNNRQHYEIYVLVVFAMPG